MLKLPIYNPWNYQTIISKNFELQDTTDWVSIWKFLEIMSDDVIDLIADANTMKLSDYVKNNWSKIAQIPAGVFGSSENAFYAIKLLFPTLWSCDYFIWNVEKWQHHWIDIMIPKWTPLEAFIDWEIIKAKQWDWVKKDDWNCVVLKWADWLIYCYEHLDEIKTQVWAKVNKWDIVWTCWKTWNATQYHLHLQIDQPTAKFHPFWSNNKQEILTNTKDPIKTLISILWVPTKDIQPKSDPTISPNTSPTIKPESNNTDKDSWKTKSNNDDFLDDISKALWV